ncbi:PREDICTED: uncharacterized protein LOC108564304 [Nicrophorus vespilloides]|uniref:Uncharacterized protein LOC108564304 n=1 Tax=Nicrophorus vespilloides TaxID=110193 RepID=A0ABM1MW43_NICVS|nr:PREDICTED: uncharacterized protein LOC108564304 [Nicrophorus vespilloides]
MKVFILIFILVVGAMASRELRSCNSCGMECENACGTRNFKTCCFNYMKKRSDLSEPLPLALDPSLRLELWLAKSRSPLYQRYYESMPQVQESREQSRSSN